MLTDKEIRKIKVTNHQQNFGYGSIAKSLGMKKSTVQMIVQREVAA